MFREPWNDCALFFMVPMVPFVGGANLDSFLTLKAASTDRNLCSPCNLRSLDSQRRESGGWA
jgi:hypothetical protein